MKALILPSLDLQRHFTPQIEALGMQYMPVRHKIALSDIKVARGCQNGAKIHVLSSNAIDFLFPQAPIHILFDLQRSFTPQIDALRLPYMLV